MMKDKVTDIATTIVVMSLAIGTAALVFALVIRLIRWVLA